MADRPRRPLLLSALALVLAIESVAAVAVHAAAPGALRGPASDLATGAGAGAASAVAEATAAARARMLFAEPEDSPADDARPLAGIAVRPTLDPGRRIEKPRAAAGVVATASVRKVREPIVRASSGGGSQRMVGRNHVWIPELGMSRSVAGFPCSRSTPPGHLVYRWGCAGRNNVYLLGHASSVFRPLHNAYVSGRLHVGLRVMYADASGTVRTYAVRSWRVMAPDGDVAWAIAAQSVPSMTIQTCVGSNSERRLVVRLVQVSG